MSAALQLAASVGLVVALAAAFLWGVEGTAKLMGRRNSWLLFLVGIPLAISTAFALSNWERLTWWERLASTVSGPVIAGGLLFGAFAALNPADALLLLCTGVRSGWRACLRCIRGRKHSD